MKKIVCIGMLALVVFFSGCKNRNTIKTDGFTISSSGAEDVVREQIEYAQSEGGSWYTPERPGMHHYDDMDFFFYLPYLDIISIKADDIVTHEGKYEYKYTCDVTVSFTLPEDKEKHSVVYNMGNDSSGRIWLTDNIVAIDDVDYSSKQDVFDKLIAEAKAQRDIENTPIPEHSAIYAEEFVNHTKEDKDHWIINEYSQRFSDRDKNWTFIMCIPYFEFSDFKYDKLVEGDPLDEYYVSAKVRIPDDDKDYPITFRMTYIGDDYFAFWDVILDDEFDYSAIEEKAYELLKNRHVISEENVGKAEPKEADTTENTAGSLEELGEAQNETWTPPDYDKILAEEEKPYFDYAAKRVKEVKNIDIREYDCRIEDFETDTYYIEVYKYIEDSDGVYHHVCDISIKKDYSEIQYADDHYEDGNFSDIWQFKPLE